MKRENRYIVLKIVDVNKALRQEDYNELEHLCAIVADSRLMRGKAPLQCVVVEADWPEYETVLGLIEARMDGKPTVIAKLRADRAALVKWRDDHRADCDAKDIKIAALTSDNLWLQKQVEEFKSRPKYVCGVCQNIGMGDEYTEYVEALESRAETAEQLCEAYKNTIASLRDSLAQAQGYKQQAEAKVIQLAENVEKLELQLADKTREHECCKIWANDTRAELEKARECLSSVHALAHNRPTKDILPEIHKLTECYHDNCTAANGGKEMRSE